MARMADNAQPLHERCGTSTHAQEARLSHTWDMTVKQAMASSNTASYSTAGRLEQINDSYKEDQLTINKNGKTVIQIHERFAHIFCNPTARAAMANPSDVQSNYSTDKSVIVMDCGASTTITGSLVNCTDIAETETLIDTAKEGEGMTATHSCNKTYFVRIREWER